MTVFTRNLYLSFFLFLWHYPLVAQNKSVILGRPTDKSITASVYFEASAEFYLEYGLSPGNYPFRTTAIRNQARKPDMVELTNLSPNTRYYYRMQWRAVNAATFTATPEYLFQTQRAAGSTFRFIVEGDEHLHDKKGVASLYRICLQNQLKGAPDFMISMGDMFGDDHTPTQTTSADMDFYHRDLLQYLGDACHSMPFFFCLGNHEGESGYYLRQTPPNNIAVYATNWRKYYFANPRPDGFYTGNATKEAYGMDLPENYYAFTWGDALFVVLDVYRHCDVNDKPQNWDWTLGKAQYDWFRQTLETSRAKYKFVFGHHTRGQGRGGILTAKDYEWGGNNGKNSYDFDKQRPGWGLPIHQLMVKNGVNIFFQGHDHLYAREALDGLVYQTSPMACDSTYTIGMLANADAYTDVTLDGSGHLQVTVSPDEVRVDFIRAYLPADTRDGKHKNGETAYSYTLKAGTPASTTTSGQTQTILADPALESDVIRIFPNPTADRLKITVGQPLATCQVTVSDAAGKELFRTSSTDIDMHTYPDGLYLFRIETGRTQITRKILIRH
ncbi:metallophosphoesterase [Arsenicibacter rosenii]|uniref:Metallophosphoesterase n=1 Tax=Arsenicibacter rosenii TaxID=1750698 RepID=A0A1S2VPM1_9BACT|nr:metallophosphoesterase [Arsenicibacter rosenii]OIN60694.1 hypothetical protein BLX24_00845 [Arsenicibacter rosenii]